MGGVPLFSAFLSFFFPPFPFTFPALSFLIEGGPLEPARTSGERCKLPSGSGAEPRPKTNLMHSKAARKPLVAIVLNILSAMFYVFEEINWRWCRHNTVQLSHIMSTVSDGVSPSPKGEGGGGAGSTPSKSLCNPTPHIVRARLRHRPAIAMS